MIQKTGFAKLITDYIQYKGLSQAKLALCRNIPLDTIKSWCSGRRSFPDNYNLHLLFGDDEDWLLEAQKLKESLQKNSDEESSANIADETVATGNFPINSDRSSSVSTLDIPSAILNEADKRFLKALLPSGKTLIFLREFVDFDQDTALNNLKKVHGYTESEIDYYVREVDRIDNLAKGTKLDSKFWENIIKMSTKEEFEKYSTSMGGLHLLELLPKWAMLRFLNHYLLIKGGCYAYGHIKYFDANQYPFTEDFTHHEPWILTLESLYEFCKMTAGGNIVIAEWESVNEGISVENIVFDNAPEGFYNWSYHKNDAEHDNYFPLCYEKILDELVYSSVLKTGYRTKKVNLRNIRESIYQLITGDVNVYIFQRIACVSDTGKAYMSWYEKNFKED